MPRYSIDLNHSQPNQSNKIRLLVLIAIAFSIGFEAFLPHPRNAVTDFEVAGFARIQGTLGAMT